MKQEPTRRGISSSPIMKSESMLAVQDLRTAGCETSGQNIDPNSRTEPLPPINSFCGLLKVGRLGVGNVLESLRIAIHQREPGTLQLHHDPMPAPKRVVDVRHRKIDLFDFSGCERFRLFEALA